jgi:hypothetical protein
MYTTEGYQQLVELNPFGALFVQFGEFVYGIKYICMFAIFWGCFIRTVLCVLQCFMIVFFQLIVCNLAFLCQDSLCYSPIWVVFCSKDWRPNFFQLFSVLECIYEILRMFLSNVFDSKVIDYARKPYWLHMWCQRLGVWGSSKQPSCVNCFRMSWFERILACGSPYIVFMILIQMYPL